VLTSRRQEEILDAAAQLFARDGYSNTTTQGLADLLQVGKGTIYRYFPTKRELFLAAVDRLMRQLQARLDASVENVADPLKRMGRVVRAYLEFFAERPHATELLIQERAQFKDRKRPTYFAYRDANAERRKEQLRELLRQGRIRDMPIERIMDVLADVLYGAMFTNYFSGRSRSPAQQAEDILDIAFYGILSESERKTRLQQRASSGRRG
jgi:AcrR family transcriptional regulator